MMVPYEFADITPNFNGKPLKLAAAYIQEPWQDSSQVKLISEESYQQINKKTKIHLGTIVPESLGNNRSSFSWSNRTSVIWE